MGERDIIDMGDDERGTGALKGGTPALPLRTIVPALTPNPALILVI